jgi:hypothetical protein
MNQPTPHPRLRDLPLWRLIVALDDVERTVGPASPTARALARAVQERLRQARAATPPQGEEVTHAG